MKWKEMLSATDKTLREHYHSTSRAIKAGFAMQSTRSMNYHFLQLDMCVNAMRTRRMANMPTIFDKENFTK